MTRRRVLFAALVLLTMLLMLWLMFKVLSPQGFDVLDSLILLAFAMTLPWTVVGFCNALVGLLVDIFAKSPLLCVNPLAGNVPSDARLDSSTAILLCIRNEMPARLVRNLELLGKGLIASEQGASFHLYVLSDTTDEQIAQQEALAFEQLAANWKDQLSLTYRRRTLNTGFKAGNIKDFCDRWGSSHDFALVLDADSLMSATAVIRLALIMQFNPQLGILQGLVVGLPTERAFTRIFQFGMRLGMRSYTMGSAWWQGDCGPYWGHNAVIRLAPFIESCDLPVLKGKGGKDEHILSHDQVEAVLMRRAGFDVRVYPLEDESYEENPPNLIDFATRDLRWCAGNMQYFRLLSWPGLKFTSRVQLLMAIFMFAGAPAWLLLLGLLGWLARGRSDLATVFDLTALKYLAIVTIVMMVAPKLSAAISVLVRARQRRSFGGTWRFSVGLAIDFVFAAFVTPILWVSQTLLLLGLLLGKRIGWGAQNRDNERVGWVAATQVFGIHTAVGLLLAWPWLASSWDVVAVLSYFIGGLVFAIPFAIVTSRASVGRAMKATELCAIPEDISPPAFLMGIAKITSDHNPPIAPHSSLDSGQ